QPDTGGTRGDRRSVLTGRLLGHCARPWKPASCGSATNIVARSVGLDATCCCGRTKPCQCCYLGRILLEARGGIEPPNKGFAGVFGVWNFVVASYSCASRSSLCANFVQGGSVIRRAGTAVNAEKG